MSRPFDLAVVGGGVGGAVTALAAGRAGLSVVLFEPQPGPIDKPCGEGCLAGGVSVLSELGLDRLVARGAPLLHATYVQAGAPPLRVPFAAPGRAFARRELAAEIAGLLERESRVLRVPAGARTEQLYGNGDERGRARFALQAGGQRFESVCLAAADGLGGRAADWLRGLRSLDAARFGLRGRCTLRRGVEASSGVTIHLRDAAGQIYLTPLPDQQLNVALLLDRAPASGGAAASFLAALAHPEVAPLIDDVVTAPEARALARRPPRAVARDGAFLVGDAAGGVDPVVGCGVSVALCTGVAAAGAARQLRDGRPAADVSADYARVVRAETAQRLRLARLLLVLSRHPALARSALRVLSRAPGLAAAIARAADRSGR